MELLVISFIALLLGVYVTLSYRAWEIRKGITSLTEQRNELKTKEFAVVLLQKIESSAKIAVRYTVFFFEKVWELASAEVKRWIMKAFPRTKNFFEEKDKLTGLYHGPASFFLANVSEYKNDLSHAMKRRMRTKPIPAPQTLPLQEK